MTGIEPIQLPPRSPNLNSHAERWVRSVKGECVSKLILFGEVSLRRVLTDFVDHFHGERNHQGKGALRKNLTAPRPARFSATMAFRVHAAVCETTN